MLPQQILSTNASANNEDTLSLDDYDDEGDGPPNDQPPLTAVAAAPPSNTRKGAEQGTDLFRYAISGKDDDPNIMYDILFNNKDFD